MRPTLPLALAFFVVTAASVRAHHAHPDFVLDRNVTVEGQLEELRYSNPHVVLKIRAADGALYSAEWQAASWLQFNAHVTLTTLRVGDHVSVTGAPSRDPSLHELVRLKEVRRLRDGWTYEVVPDRSVAGSRKQP